MKLITSLDIGSNTIKAVTAQIESLDLQESSDNSNISIIGVNKKQSIGVRKGVIIDINDAAFNIKKILDELEKTIGQNIDEVIAGINGDNILGINAKGIVAVSRADKEISNIDIERAIQSAKTSCIAPNREIINVVSRFYNIDNEKSIKNPIGMSGIKLEADTLIITASSPLIKNVTKVINMTGRKVITFIPGIIASGESVLSNRQKELGVLILDIGSDTTGLLVYEEGELVHLEIKPFGADHITNDIAIGLRIDIDTAEKIKIKFGSCVPDEIRKTEIINLNELGIEGDFNIRRRDVSLIIEARMKEIFSVVNISLDNIGKRGFLPAGVILVGGGSNLHGIIEMAKKYLRLPVRTGYPEKFKGLVDEITDPSFTMSTGLLSWYGKKIKHDPVNRNEYFGKLGSKFKSFFHKISP